MKTKNSTDTFLPVIFFQHKDGRNYISFELINQQNKPFEVESFSVIICDSSIGLSEIEYEKTKECKIRLAAPIRKSLKSIVGEQFDSGENLQFFKALLKDNEELCKFFYKSVHPYLNDIIIQLITIDLMGIKTHTQIKGLNNNLIKYKILKPVLNLQQEVL